jgi:hypothetical protein
MKPHSIIEFYIGEFTIHVRQTGWVPYYTHNVYSTFVQTTYNYASVYALEE